MCVAGWCIHFWSLLTCLLSCLLSPYSTSSSPVCAPSSPLSSPSTFPLFSFYFYTLQSLLPPLFSFTSFFSLLILAPKPYCAVKRAITWQQLRGRSPAPGPPHSWPSEAADCTVSLPGGSTSITLASHSRVNKEPGSAQSALARPASPHRTLSLLYGSGDNAF